MYNPYTCTIQGKKILISFPENKRVEASFSIPGMESEVKLTHKVPQGGNLEDAHQGLLNEVEKLILAYKVKFPS